jgi:putative flavoprotein involved in K+ transport
MNDSDPNSPRGDPEHQHAPIRRDVVVIGAGQAGLAVGYFLAQRGSKFIILDAGDKPASTWRARWDSLRLFTPARYSSLPGLPFPGDPDHYPDRDEVATYLTDYARRFDLPVALESRVRAVTKLGETYRIELDGTAYESDQVVIATGAFQAPFVPGMADSLDPDTLQLHSTGYRDPRQMPSGVVLVAGGGNTGFQIAEELSESHEVHLSIGSRQPSLPQRVLGRDLFWYLEKTGLITKTTETRVGRRLRERDTLIGSSARNLRRRGVKFRSRTVAAAGPTITFSDGTQLNPDVVIWATGFRHDHAWVQVPVFTPEGTLIHRRGVTESPGLYFLGLPWMHTRGSALLGWVKDDAEYIAHQISALPARPAPAETTATQPV